MPTEYLCKSSRPWTSEPLPRGGPPQWPGSCAVSWSVSKLGNHLLLSAAESYGPHYVFETPRDKIVWDTGHQTYGHKILTGRREALKRIRQADGISGFLKRDESEYDAFGAGHASTAISAATGMAAARDLKNEKYKVVAVVSDGCITGGESYEGLTNAGALQTDIIVVLNDNQMFISNKVGAMSTFLTRLLTLGAVRDAGAEVKKFLARFKFWGAVITRVVQRARVLLFPGMLFEEMGFQYFGPVDGHDLPNLVEVLRHVSKLKGPVLVHCVTKKGKGYDAAEKDPYTWHGPGKFDVAQAKMIKGEKPAAPSYTAVFGKSLVKLAEEDPRVVAISAAMPEGTGTDLFRERFPKRFYDVGLAEPHAVTFAGGLACEGYRPVVAIYSTFLQRAYDQIEHDVCLQKLPVILCLDRAGLVGEDGPTHHGVFDYSYLRMIPGMTVMAPADENELQNMLRTALSMNSAVSLRYPRGEGVGVHARRRARDPACRQGRAPARRPRTSPSPPSATASPRPSRRPSSGRRRPGWRAQHAFVKPLDRDLLLQALDKSDRLVTVEDNVIQGGFGSAVLEALAEAGRTAKVLRLGIPDSYVSHGTQDQLYAQLRIDGPGIAARTAEWLGAKVPARA
jgi:1-deoxy-D-xylulose-5-phosphate synthase